jgi:hypothetical protein
LIPKRLKAGVAREKVQVLAESRAASLSAASSLSTTSRAVTEVSAITRSTASVNA